MIHSSRNLCNSVTVQLALLVGAMSFVGCGKHPEFSENRLLIKRLEIEIGEQLSSVERQDVQQAVAHFFGSADQPVLPEGVDVVSLQNLKQAAGRIFSNEQDEHFGLYQNNCIRCHGTSGDGYGPAARLLSPYPRDFRLGKFKFKTTPQGSKPTKNDLAKIIRHGIPGTSMPGFGLLPEKDIDSLVDYVIYLSVRGEFERSLLYQVAHTLDYARGDRLIDFELSNKQPEEFQQQLSKLEQSLKQLYSTWKVQPVEEPALPSNFPVIGAVEIDASNQTALAESIHRGQQLFQSSVASCSKCHAADGSGRGAPKDYDDWTKDWTSAINIAADDKQAIKPLLKAGGLKPVLMMPRDLRKGVFRGGSAPQDIYARIVNGIQGTSMPAVALQKNIPHGLTSDQVWDLVNFVFSLSEQPARSSKHSSAKRVVDTREVEVGLADVGLADAGRADIGRADVGLADVGLADVGLADVGLADVGLADVGLTDVGLTDVGRCDVGLIEIGRSDLGGGLVDARAVHIESSDVRLLKIQGGLR